tara:strand:- start:131 stop:352 length:222 start_codon:yes stop_codon:yes gene_type:complete
MEFIFLKKSYERLKNLMNKLKLVTIIYAIGIIIGALFFDVWGAETTLLKTMSIFIWTILFLIVLFYVDKNEKK